MIEKIEVLMDKYEEQTMAINMILSVITFASVSILSLSFFLTAKYEDSIFKSTNLGSFFASVQPLEAGLAYLTICYSVLNLIDAIVTTFIINTTEEDYFSVFIEFFENLIYGFYNHILLAMFEPNLPISAQALKFVFIGLISFAFCSVFSIFADDVQMVLCYYACSLSGLAFLTVLTCIIVESFLPRKVQINGQTTMFISSCFLLCVNLIRVCADIIADKIFYVEATQIIDYCQFGVELSIAISYIKWKRLGSIIAKVMKREKTQESGLVQNNDDNMVYI